MFISNIDWIIIISVLLISMIIGLLVMKRAGKNPDEYFAGGKNLPWWLLGISMVATTFSTDTPNLVTDIVREHGVSGNWVWFAFLITGMLTVYIYARLWKRSGVLTDIEFYELRYSGKSAAFLRGFRALYLGVIFNVIIMATVTLAAIKIGNILIGLKPWETVVFTGIIIIIYSSLGGLRGVLLTDFFQFFLAMFGAFYLMFYSVKKAGGIEAIVNNELVVNKLSLLPDFSDTGTLIAIFIVPLAVQWWAVWYPGAEPGGGGYIAQRMFAAKDEKNALTGFCRKIKPANRGWEGFYKLLSENEKKDIKISTGEDNFPGKIANIFLGTLSVYSFLFSVGFLLEDKIPFLIISLSLFIISVFFLIKNQKNA